jgi:hypothetical protein
VLGKLDAFFKWWDESDREPSRSSSTAGRVEQMKKTIWFSGGAILVILIGYGALSARKKFTVELPKYPPITNSVWLDQSWTAEQRDWFHRADQGTQTFGIPYEWFIALEQPELALAAPGLLRACLRSPEQ